MKRFTRDELIDKCIEKYGDAYNYEKVEYVNMHTPVSIICNKCGNTFNIIPANFLSKNNTLKIGCTNCLRRKKNRYWTKERNLEEAKKYKTKKDFKQKCGGGFCAASENGWLKTYFWLNTIKPKGYWNYETCKEAALKYKTKSEFQKGDRRAYNLAREKGWIEEYVWLKDARIEIFKGKIDSVYAYFFEEYDSVYVGRTLMRLQKDRDWSHRHAVYIDGKFKKHYVKSDSVYNFSVEKNCEIPEMIILDENLTIEEGQEREKYWIEFYKKQGKKLLNKAPAGSIGTLGFKKRIQSYDRHE